MFVSEHISYYLVNAKSQLSQKLKNIPAILFIVVDFMPEVYFQASTCTSVKKVIKSRAFPLSTSAYKSHKILNSIDTSLLIHKELEWIYNPPMIAPYVARVEF